MRPNPSFFTSRLLTVLSFFPSVLFLSAQPQPAPPAAAPATPPPEIVPLSLFSVPDDLEVTLWAQSPQFSNPSNIDIDAQGRIWISEAVNYRRHVGKDPAGDRIVVLEDSDGDGRADKNSVFVQEAALLAPLGVAVIDNQ